MSGIATLPTLERAKRLPWGLWIRQVWSILRLEGKKNTLGKRLFAVYILALAPVILLGIRAVLPLHQNELGNVGEASVIFAVLFQFFILRFVVFLGCVGIFTTLFRGEVLEKTLHYYLLTPVRREILVIGKYLSGVVLASVLFGGSTFISYILLYLPFGRDYTREFFLNGVGFSHLWSYVAITVLACLGYGAVFLLMGLLFRNPKVPAAVVFGRESINFLLPSFLRKISIIHYLMSITPVSAPPGPLAIIVEPTSPWISVPGLLVLTAVAIIVATLKIRNLEFTYGAD